VPYTLKPDQWDVKTPNERITAPFTPAQMEAIANWQRWSACRSTCPVHPDLADMTVSSDGIRCTAEGCAHVKDWAYAFILKVKYCTADARSRYVPGEPTEDWIHANATQTDTDDTTRFIPFHCPNCGLRFEIDCE
jgi:hypothetical protein